MDIHVHCTPIHTHTHTDPLSHLTGTPKVHNPNGTSLGIAEQYVLWLEIAVDDVERRVREKEESSAELLGKLASEIERDASEVGVAEEFVEVVGEKFEY